ncbi:hypothetical protein PR048_027812 [Dryococelus australis]|uniref:Uncharacterized protein n=1 Tax=Dryococelus australis TaxID=614101 RepID=A0ABQ9GHJ5_9NEOP|nr:hypothetical protein PR048_027812 [Dryococelus australis]
MISFRTQFSWHSPTKSCAKCILHRVIPALGEGVRVFLDLDVGDATQVIVERNVELNNDESTKNSPEKEVNGKVEGVLGLYSVNSSTVPDLKIVILDGCCYQNRNTTLSNALLHVAMTNNVVIERKYLEKGHTQMETDSMYATIEQQLKHKTINDPADYVHTFRSARKNPHPYVVKYVNHEYFKQFDQHHFYTTIRPRRKYGEPTVTDLRALRYCPDRNIFEKHGSQKTGLFYQTG